MNLKDIARCIDARPTRYYRSKLDPEGKVITEDGPDGIKLHIRPDVYREFISNTWIKPKKNEMS